MKTPKQTRWTCLHCGHNHRWKYDPWYTRVMGTIPYAHECRKCFKSTVVQMVKPGLYKSLRKLVYNFTNSFALTKDGLCP